MKCSRDRHKRVYVTATEDEYNHFRVRCPNCFIGFQGFDAEAITAWNRRFVCLHKDGDKVYAGDKVNVYYRDAASAVGIIEWDGRMHCWAIHIANEGNYRLDSDTEIELVKEPKE